MKATVQQSDGMVPELSDSLLQMQPGQQGRLHIIIATSAGYPEPET